MFAKRSSRALKWELFKCACEREKESEDSVYKAGKPCPFPMRLRFVEMAIILLSFGFFVVITHRSLPLFPVGLILHSIPLSLSRYIFIFVAPFLFALHYFSQAVARCFMGCLLKRGSITDPPPSPLPFLPCCLSSASPGPGGIVGVQLFLLCHSSVA